MVGHYRCLLPRKHPTLRGCPVIGWICMFLDQVIVERSLRLHYWSMF
jgi:hypothetical protein